MSKRNETLPTRSKVNKNKSSKQYSKGRLKNNTQTKQKYLKTNLKANQNDPKQAEHILKLRQKGFQTDERLF